MRRPAYPPTNKLGPSLSDSSLCRLRWFFPGCSLCLNVQDIEEAESLPFRQLEPSVDHTWALLPMKHDIVSIYNVTDRQPMHMKMEKAATTMCGDPSISYAKFVNNLTDVWNRCKQPT